MNSRGPYLRVGVDNEPAHPLRRAARLLRGGKASPVGVDPAQPADTAGTRLAPARELRMRPLASR